MTIIDQSAGLTHDELAVLLREFLLCGHLIDRSGMPQVISRLGRDVMRDIAIDEWMGASPVYVRRVQRALGFDGGDDVATIFKGMQVDIGAPPQFMDFRYVVHNEHHGEFFLAHCGALMDVEPLGDDFVVAMCHHIEDPTFDATACATNPRARVRPIHRPPRVPSDRHPHCHWTVIIDPDAEPIEVSGLTDRIAATHAASWDRPGRAQPDDGEPDDAEPDDGARDDGRNDYLGPVDPDLRMEDFSSATLRLLLDEVALQWHLLSMAFMAALEDRSDSATARAVGVQQCTGIAGLTAERIRLAVDLDASLDSLATVLRLHPVLRPPGYVRSDIVVEDDRVRLSVAECPASGEVLPSWIALLRDGEDRPLHAIAAAVDPRYRVTRVGEAEWEIALGVEPAKELSEVTLTRFSTGADFRFA